MDEKVIKENFLKRIYQKIREISNLHDDTNIEATIASITKDIEFKGANVWILFLAVIVASVGLNVNSTAVIIGAMLISPLMGPINGVGLAIGIDDNMLLRTSLRNLLIMVVISLTASTTYFLVSPLSDAQSELLARTTPTIFDVLIAFFGGMAGIVAASRKEGKITIISGVAIATALMPPLCTAGYGLATGQFSYFFGAFYLFFINSFFIALATFIVVRYLRFPVKEIVDPVKRRVQRRNITIFSVLMIVPSVYMAWNVVGETRFNSQAIKYVQTIQNEVMFEDVEILNVRREYDGKKKAIHISLVGNALSESQIRRLENRLAEFGLENTVLKIKQTSGSLDLGAQAGVISKLLEKKDEELQAKETENFKLRTELKKLNDIAGERQNLGKELSIQYPEVVGFSVSRSIFYDNLKNTTDTIPVFYAEFSRLPDADREAQLLQWLRVRLQYANLKLIKVEKEK